MCPESELVRLSMTSIERTKIVVGSRPDLEDRAQILERGASLVVVVADGAGGRPGGARAAELAVRLVEDDVATVRELRDPEEWCRVLARADRTLLSDPAAGETTAVVAVVSPEGITGASVVDSGAWLITSNGFQDLTARQRRKPGLGTGGAVAVPLTARGPAGTLLVASDGLFRYADAEQICEAVRESDLDAAARSLVDLVRLPQSSASSAAR